MRKPADKTALVGVKLPPAVKAALQAMCDAEVTTPSQVGRGLFTELLRKKGYLKTEGPPLGLPG